MKTNAEIRRENLRLLADSLGSVTNLSKAIDRSPSQVSQWLNASPDSQTGKPRTINNDSARYIEKTCKKPTGWLDQPHESVNDAPYHYPSPPNYKAVNVLAERQILEITTEKAADDFAKKVTRAANEGRITRDQIEILNRTLDQFK